MTMGGPCPDANPRNSRELSKKQATFQIHSCSGWKFNPTAAPAGPSLRISAVRSSRIYEPIDSVTAWVEGSSNTELHKSKLRRTVIFLGRKVVFAIEIIESVTIGARHSTQPRETAKDRSITDSHSKADPRKVHGRAGGRFRVETREYITKGASGWLPGDWIQ
jgi:hypothetical protein